MPLFRRITLTVGLVAVGLYAALVLVGPQGVSALLAKYRQIGSMEERVRKLKAENDEKRRKAAELLNNPSVLEPEIRKQLNLQRKNETTYKLGESAPQPSDR